MRVKNGSTTTEQVVAAINGEGTFTAEIDSRDATLVKQAGQGVIDLAATGITDGGGGEALDQESGLRISNGGKTYDIDMSTATRSKICSTRSMAPARACWRDQQPGTGH